MVIIIYILHREPLNHPNKQAENSGRILNNLIPAFIVDKVKKNEMYGQIIATTMFVDIIGFSTITQSLAKYGKEGIEVLNKILYEVFNPAIDEVHNNSGFVSSFEGDGFTSVFPEPASTHTVCQTALHISEAIRSSNPQKLKFDSCDFHVRIGLSHGPVDWGIVGSVDYSTFYFKGSPIENCAFLQKKCPDGKILLDQNLFRKIGEEIYCESYKENYILTGCKQKLNSSPPPIQSSQVDREIAQRFHSVSMLDNKSAGEFRDVGCVFISMGLPELYKDINDVVGRILTIVADFGGYFEGLSYDDNGAHCLIIFGAPSSCENNALQAIEFADYLRFQFNTEFRAGITFGQVFAGIKGSIQHSTYGVIGDVVNLSARFCLQANWGEILTDRCSNEQILTTYSSEFIGNLDLHGFSEPIPGYCLCHRKSDFGIKKYSVSLVGRQDELKHLKNRLLPLQKGQNAGIIYVYGDAGIGKSHFIREFSTRNNLQTISLASDKILRKNLNPIVRFLSNYFNQVGTDTPEERKEKFSRKFQNITLKIIELSKSKGEYSTLAEGMKRNESIMGSVIGLSWENSLHSRIPLDNLEIVKHLAIKDFFLTLSVIRPLVILIEDFQWMDNETISVLELLTRDVDDYPILLIAESRIRDDGSKPSLDIDDQTTVTEIKLTEISFEDSTKLAKNLLSAQLSEELQMYIYGKMNGNPFYTEQFCLYLRENDCLKLTENKLHLVQKTDDIPANINMILISRIDRLSAELKEVVQVASVLGSEFEVRILVSLIGFLKSLDSDQTDIRNEDVVVPLITDGSKQNIWFALTELRYIFNHILLRDAAYEMQLRSRLRILHQLAAETILKVFPDDNSYLVNVSYHFEEAEEWEKATEYYLKAGTYMFQKVQFKDAERCCKRGLYAYDKLIEPKLEMKSNYLFLLGKIYSDLSELEKGESSLTEALKIITDIHGKRSSEAAVVFEKIGTLFRTKGDYKKALSYFDRSLEISLELFDEKHEDVGASYNNIGIVYLKMYELDVALEYFKKSLAIVEDTPGKNRINAAEIYNNLGTLLAEKQEYDKAMTYHESALEIRKEHFGDRHPEIALTYNNLGQTSTEMGDFEKALDYLNIALEMTKEFFGERHPQIAMIHNNIGHVYFLREDLASVLPHLMKALNIKREIFGKNHPETALYFDNLGTLYGKMGEFKLSLEHLETSFQIFKKIFTLDHPRTALSMEKKASVYYYMDDFKRAEPLFEKALQIFVSTVGENHHLTVMTLEAMIRMYQDSENRIRVEELSKRLYKIKNADID